MISGGHTATSVAGGIHTGTSIVKPFGCKAIQHSTQAGKRARAIAVRGCGPSHLERRFGR